MEQFQVLVDKNLYQGKFLHFFKAKYKIIAWNNTEE